MSGLNTSLRQARRAKNDEFYTQRTDIEKEVRHYKVHFEGKTVYCNCDDPRVSEFTKLFLLKFESYGLRKLIATCYRNTNPDIFTLEAEERGASIMVADAESAASGGVIETLDGDGDFRSAECIELLKEADIVVTNPPFSLFREYIAQLMAHDKKFLVVGNQNAITYKEIFPLIQSNALWLGITPKGQDMLFDVPEGRAVELVENGKDGSAYRVVNGVVKGRLGNAAWFTNLDHNRRHEPLLLWRRYAEEPELFPKYDNYDAINIDKTADIPEDHDGPMGVPITFLDKYCPEQFEILGITDRGNAYGLKTKEYMPADTPEYGNLNRRGAIRANGGLQSTYARILIRRRRG